MATSNQNRVRTMAHQWTLILIVLAYSTVMPQVGLQATQGSIALAETSLNGITLGMSHTDVLQRLGPPDAKSQATPDVRAFLTERPRARERTSVQWTWNSGPSLFFDSNYHVVVIESNPNLALDWEGSGPLRVSQIIVAASCRTGSSTIKSLLGTPGLVLPDETVTTDTILAYKGPNDVEITFQMGGGRIVSTSLAHSRFLPDEL